MAWDQTTNCVSITEVTSEKHTLASLAFVELYLPAHIGEFFSSADFPPKTSTRMFRVAFSFPLLLPLLAGMISDEKQHRSNEKR